MSFKKIVVKAKKNSKTKIYAQRYSFQQYFYKMKNVKIPCKWGSFIFFETRKVHYRTGVVFFGVRRIFQLV